MVWLVENATVEEQADFLNAHLLNWVSGFAADIEKYAGTDFYRAVGRVTAAFLTLEGEYLSALLSGEVRLAPGYSIRADRMDPIFARLKEKYRIFAPRRFPGRGPRGGDLIRYGEIGALTDIEYKEKSHFSAKEVFYPISQTMFYFNGKRSWTTAGTSCCSCAPATSTPSDGWTPSSSTTVSLTCTTPVCGKK